MALNIKDTISKSFYDNISNNYSDSLSIEVAELQRQIYLPLLPLEKMSYSVLTAYEYLGKYYWTKDDVYTAMRGNFYIPIMFPMVANTESTEAKQLAPTTSTLLNETEGYDTKEFVTRNYVEMDIPRDIVMQFHNVIPKGTQFNIAFIGGNAGAYTDNKGEQSTMRIVSIAKAVPIPEDVRWNDDLYECNDLSFSGLLNLIQENLAKIEEEEALRKEEEEEYRNMKFESDIDSTQTTGSMTVSSINKSYSNKMIDVKGFDDIESITKELTTYEDYTDDEYNNFDKGND